MIRSINMDTFSIGAKTLCQRMSSTDDTGIDVNELVMHGDGLRETFRIFLWF